MRRPAGVPVAAKYYVQAKQKDNLRMMPIKKKHFVVNLPVVPRPSSLRAMKTAALKTPLKYNKLPYGHMLEPACYCRVLLRTLFVAGPTLDHFCRALDESKLFFCKQMR